MKRKNKGQVSKKDFFEVVDVIPISPEDLDSYNKKFPNEIDINALLSLAEENGVSFENGLFFKGKRKG